MDPLERRFPRRRLDLDESAAVAKWQQAVEWEMLSAGPDGAADRLVRPVAGAWGVAYRDTLRALQPSALQRSVQVVAVDALEDAVPVVAAQGRFLQTAGVAVAPEALYRLAELLGAAGVTRIAAIGAMSVPEAGWHHDGRFNLLDLVRMVEIEQSAEAAAEPLAPYAD